MIVAPVLFKQIVMKKTNIFLSLCALLPLVACSTKKIDLLITNPATEERVDEPVVFAIPSGYRSAVVTIDGKEIPSQLDDMNENGIKDEIAFVMNIGADETKEAKIVLSKKEAPADKYPARVHAQMFFRDKKTKEITPTDTASSTTGDLYNSLHHHGPAFESELVAYRLYFDRKQTVDLYGKYNKGLELAESLWYPTDEQLERGFGDDILRVSGSVGIGTLKGWNGKKAIHIEPVGNREAKIIAKGPVRTVVDMNVTGWEYQGEKVDVKSRFILFAGQRESDVIHTFSDNAKNLMFATGVQDIVGSENISDKKGMTAIWGRDWPVNDTVKYAKQTVGLAVEIPEKYIVEELKDKVNYLYGIRPDEDNKIEYKMVFCAEKENFGYKTAEDFFNYVNEWKEKLPLIVKEK